MAGPASAPPGSTGHILPPGWGRVEGAVAAGGWILSWKERNAFAWTPSEKPLVLPAAPGEIRTGVAVRRGVFVFAAKDCKLGFWPFGAPRWSWWRQLDTAPSDLLSPVEGMALVVSEEEDGARLELLDPDESGPGVVGRARVEGMGLPLGAWPDPATGDLLVLAMDGRYRWSNPRRGDGSVVREAEHAVPEVLHRATVIPTDLGPVFAPRPSGPAQRYDPVAGRFELLPLVHIDGCAPLWSAWCAGDRATAKSIVALFRAAVPPLWAAGLPRLYDVLMNGREPVAAATNAGIWVAGRCPADDEPEEQRRFQADLVSTYASNAWELWIDRKAALPDAVVRLIECIGERDALGLAGAVLEPGVERAVDELLGELRAQWPEPRHSWRPDGIRALCLRAGRAIVPCIERAFADPSPAAQWFAIAAAGTVELGEPFESSHRSALYDDPQAAWGARLAGLVCHEAERVSEAALESAVNLQLHGVADAAAALLDSPDETRRYLVAEALQVLPGASSTTLEALRRAALEDESAIVRRYAIPAVGKAMGWPAVRETLLRAATCTDWRDQDVALRAIAGKAVDPAFGLADALAAGDIEWVTRTALRKGEAEPYWWYRHDDFWEDVAREFDVSGPDDLGKLQPDRKELLFGCMLVMIFEARAVGSADEFLEEEELQIFELLLQQREGWTSPAEIGDLRLLCGKEVPPLVLGQVALKVLERTPELGARLAQLAQIVLGPWKERFGSRGGEEGAGGGDTPLHRLLRRMGKPHPVPLAVRSFVEARSREPGRNGLVALYALARGGDREALALLQQALLDGAPPDVGFLVIAFLLQLDEAKRGPFLEQFLGREDLVPRELRAYRELQSHLQRA